MAIGQSIHNDRVGERGDELGGILGGIAGRQNDRVPAKLAQVPTEP